MKHLTHNNRYYIYQRLKQGDSIRAIAKVIKASHSTIAREIKRNKGYRYKLSRCFIKILNKLFFLVVVHCFFGFFDRQNKQKQQLL